jgi:hypothetical protein
MGSSTALEIKSQTRENFQDHPAQARQTLSPFQAARIKRQLITRYCRGELSENAVENYFKVFPELRSA